MRFKLTCDDDGHWYLIPAEFAEEVEEYLENVYRYWSEGLYDEDEPQPPCEMQRVNPYCVTFENPSEDM